MRNVESSSAWAAWEDLQSDSYWEVLIPTTTWAPEQNRVLVYMVAYPVEAMPKKAIHQAYWRKAPGLQRVSVLSKDWLMHCK